MGGTNSSKTENAYVASKILVERMVTITRNFFIDFDSSDFGL